MNTKFWSENLKGRDGPRHRSEDYIKMRLEEMGCVDVDWIHPAEERVQWRGPANTIMNLGVL
jgi:hypothetical protein